MGRLPFVDAHVHLWDRGRLRYPWLDDPGCTAIADTYRVADYRRELAAWNVAGSVHVEAGAHPDDGQAETEWLEAVAETDGMPSVIVARVELDDPDMDSTLAWQAARPRVRGIRHLINWHPADAARRAYPRNLAEDPAWRRGFAMLADHGLGFDFHGFPPQLAALASLAERHPRTAVVINHLGLPIPADGLEVWRAGLVALAALPQVSIKLSGAWFVGDDALADDVVCEVLELFGTGRAMIATNFPTDRLGAGIDATLGRYERLLGHLPEAARRDLWGRNANRIYRMGLDV